MPDEDVALPNLKLGKGPVKDDPRNLKMAKYMQAVVLPAPPPSVNYTQKVTKWPMYLNDKLGDCTCAGAAHHIQCWTANVSTQRLVTDNQVLKAYEDVGGYRPGDPSTDNGAVMLDVLNYWRKTGIGGFKIAGFVQVNLANRTEFEQALWLFGGVYLGVALPLTAADQYQAKQTWQYVTNTGRGTPNSWGGHAIPVVGYDGTYSFCVTWGMTQPLSWKFLSAYGDEAYAVLSQDWISRVNLKAPSGFNFQQLQTDLGQFHG